MLGNEPLKDRIRLEHIAEAADNISRYTVARYLAEVDWEEWEKNEVVIKETVTHKSLIQTAERMKRRGYDTEEICKITGLGLDEIETL